MIANMSPAHTLTHCRCPHKGTALIAAAPANKADARDEAKDQREKPAESRSLTRQHDPDLRAALLGNSERASAIKKFFLGVECSRMKTFEGREKEGRKQEREREKDETRE